MLSICGSNCGDKVLGENSSLMMGTVKKCQTRLKLFNRDIMRGKDSPVTLVN